MDRYIKIDEKVEGIVKKVSLYMRNLNYDYIKNEIFRAYLYARDAHEWQNRFKKKDLNFWKISIPVLEYRWLTQDGLDKSE